MVLASTNRMEVQQLRHLLAAVHYGNLVKAAEGCHISQSGLSRSIKSLEQRLGVSLLIRHANGVEPTVYGLKVLEHAKIILNEVQRSVKEIDDVRAGQTGEVNIGITHNYAHYLLPKIVAEFADRRRAIRINAVAVSFPNLVEMVKVGEVDFGLGLLSAIEDTPDLIIEEIMESHARVLARAEHPLVGKPNVSVAALAQQKWAMLDSVSLQRKFVNHFQNRGRHLPKQVVKTNSVVLLKRVLSSMDALTVLPLDMVRDELANGELHTIDCETPADYARAGLIFRKSMHASPAMEQLIARIRQEALSEQAVPAV